MTMLMAALHNRWLTLPFKRVRDLIAQLARGSVPGFSASDATGEVGALEKNLEKHVSRMREIASFANSLAAGDFTRRFEEESTEDELGASMLSLRRNLKESREESDARSREEEHRTWSAQGLARFSALFREAEDDLEELAGLFVKEVVGYTAADVGALFIVREGDDEVNRVLEMYGSYAYDRQKHTSSSFAFGEGLVGRAAEEKEPVYITDLPPGYIRIRSGLGEDAPSSLLLVPLLVDQQVVGVIELASLGEIPSHQREFIAQLGEALATTIARVRATRQMRLLFEQTTRQAEKFSHREQMFRQQVEQLEKELEALRKK